MKNWQRWMWVTAWIGWLLASWCSAQVTPQYVLPGGTVKWTIPIGSSTSGDTYTVKVGPYDLPAKVSGTSLAFTVPAGIFEGVVPLRAMVKGSTYAAEIVVVGQDAQVGDDSEITVNWIECNSGANSNRIKQELNGVVTGIMTARPSDVKVVQAGPVRTYPLGGKTGACRCQVVEVGVRVGLTTTDAARRADALGSVLTALRALNNEPSSGSTSPEPLIVRSVMTHGLYHAGPDHVPLVLSGSSPIESFDVTEFTLATPGQKKVLVAILDTGFSPSAGSAFFKTPLPQITFTRNGITTTNFGDPFDVQRTIPNLALHQGSGHGTPAAWIVDREARAAVDILPVGVCDRNGLCRDPQIMQGLCHAATYYRDHQATYSGGLIINLSLGSFTPSESLRAVLDDVTRKTTVTGTKPWVVAAAGNYVPNEMKRNKLSGNPPVYAPSTITDWDKFALQYPYATVYPAGFGANSSSPGALTPLFTANSHIIGVGSLEHLKSSGQWQLADTSMRSKSSGYVRVCAPGRYVMSVDVNGKSAAYSGTSYAAPVFTGLLATMLSKTPGVDWATIIGHLPDPVRTSCL